MQSAKIILMCVAAAILYGILHDQFTARICVEYFTVFHPPVFPTQSPTLLALGWGALVATWWVGAFLGVLLAVAARVGPRRRTNATELLRPVITLLAMMGAVAAIARVAGYVLGERGAILLRSLWHPSCPSRGKHDSWLIGGLIVHRICLDSSEESPSAFSLFEKGVVLSQTAQ